MDGGSSSVNVTDVTDNTDVNADAAIAARLQAEADEEAHARSMQRQQEEAKQEEAKQKEANQNAAAMDDSPQLDGVRCWGGSTPIAESSTFWDWPQFSLSFGGSPSQF